MSWLKRALTICSSDNNTFYSATDSMELYEWEFSGFIPKGTSFFEKLPKTETVVNDKVIISSEIPLGFLDKDSKGYYLIKDLPAKANIVAGCVASPEEIYDKYISLTKSFDRKLDIFKKSTETQKFLMSKHLPPQLYKITDSSAGLVRLETYGPISKIEKKFSEVQEKLNSASNKKQGRAFEKEDTTRFDTFMKILENKSFPIDANRIEYLLTKSSSSPDSSFSMKWRDLFTSLTEEGRALSEHIKKFESYKWLNCAIYSNKSPR